MTELLRPIEIDRPASIAKSHPMINLCALEGMRLVGRLLARALADGSNCEARAGLALASLYGGYSLGRVNTAAGHAVAYPPDTLHHVAHGQACAVISPHTLAFSAPAMPEKTALVLDALRLAGARDMLAASHCWCAALGMEMRRSALGVTAYDLPIMTTEAHAIRRLLDNNPREMSRDDILALYRAAF